MAFNIRRLQEWHLAKIVLEQQERPSLHCMLSLAAQCIVISPVCVFATGGRHVFVGVFVGLLPR